MKFALFQGCNIPSRVAQYADATRAVSHKLDIELIDIRRATLTFVLLSYQRPKI
jgi:heterodisulfide reductase subunit B